MEHSVYDRIRRVLRALGRRRQSRRFTFTDASVLEVYIWAALHDRPVSWACDPRHWPPGSRRGPIPSASTVSRRMRRPRLVALIDRLRRRIEDHTTPALVAAIDGKPLPIGPHSHDRQSGYGRAAGGKAKGYKLHAIVDIRGRVLAWRIAPMNTDERVMARRMLRSLDHTGYLLADSNYDSNKLYKAAIERGVQLVAPRRYGPHRGVGRRAQSPARLRAKDILELDPTGFGRGLKRLRWSIERFFGTLCSRPGGLGPLPAWVRSHRRVRAWVAAKLLINAVRTERVVQ